MNSEFGIKNLESDVVSQFASDGFYILKSLIENVGCDRLSADLTPRYEQQQESARSKIGGVRNLLRTNSLVREVANSSKLLLLLEKLCGCSVFPVRAIFFDKNPQANWLVPWHQDLAIAVVEQIETPGFTGWSIKDNTPHVHPPRDILDAMVTLRLHLDDCAASNGALKVITGSHRHGKLGRDEISSWTNDATTVICELSKGDALLMRPLLLHASPPAETPHHRRVLHIEYAAQELPNGLKWFIC